MQLPAFLTGIPFAGMPATLPEDIARFLRLNEGISARLQSISFFLLGLAVATFAVQGLWNFIARDSRWLPALSFPRACCVVLLWSSLFVVVLTMISGARELLTPGAWKKDGYTYTLEQADGVAAPGPEATSPASQAEQTP